MKEKTKNEKFNSKMKTKNQKETPKKLNHL